MPEVRRIVGPRRRRRTGARPDGAQRDRHLPGARSRMAEWRQPGQGMADRRDPQGPRRTFRASPTASPSRSTCACRRCSPARAATSRSRSSAPTSTTLNRLARRDRAAWSRRSAAPTDVCTLQERRACSICRRQSTALAAGRVGLTVDDMQPALRAQIEGRDHRH
ncbi:MAG: hypothetical protein MZW92_42765 [Comamonadaceae bacterium]|nr:hypothetical protein [Comamonadaceae bacterium]